MFAGNASASASRAQPCRVARTPSSTYGKTGPRCQARSSGSPVRRARRAVLVPRFGCREPRVRRQSERRAPATRQGPTIEASNRSRTRTRCRWFANLQAHGYRRRLYRVALAGERERLDRDGQVEPAPLARREAQPTEVERVGAERRHPKHRAYRRAAIIQCVRWFRSYGFADVFDDLIVGAYPLDQDDVDTLARLGIARVLNLTEDADTRRAIARRRRALADAGIAESRCRSPTMAASLPARAQTAVRAVSTWLDEGERTYVHCRAGWQRSAAVAAGVVAARTGMDIDDALNYVRRRKPSADPLPHQREDLRRWWEGRREARRGEPPTRTAALLSRAEPPHRQLLGPGLPRRARRRRPPARRRGRSAR